MQAQTYSSAGVDIDAGILFAQMIGERVATAWPESGKEIGGFAGGGPIPAGAVRVEGSTDGAGTKAIIAALTEQFSGIGQDAVAMSAVDAYVAGARPLYLLDSLKTGRLKPEVHIAILDSVIRGCQMAGCSLIGGETAEMPGMFRHPWMFDLDTFVIAFPDPALAFLPVEPGQKVYGWFSKGPGSNGYSLIRKVFNLDDSPSKIRKRLNRHWPELMGQKLADALLEPTPIWIREMEQQRMLGVKYAGHAHITGGGMIDNIPRILPENCKAVIDRSKWRRPFIFPLIQKVGQVPAPDMDRTFNQGIMAVSIIAEDSPAINDNNSVLIGQVEMRNGDEPQVQLMSEYNDW